MREQEYSDVKSVGVTVDVCKKAIRAAVGEGLALDDMTSALTEAKIEQKAAQAFTAVVEARRNDVMDRLAKEASSMFPRSLRDFDWSLKMVMASDKLADINDTIMTLSLNISRPNGPPETVRLELNKESLDNLLKACSAAGKTVRQLSHDG